MMAEDQQVPQQAPAPPSAPATIPRVAVASSNLAEVGDLLARVRLDLAARETIQRQHAAHQRLVARLGAPAWRRAWRWMWGWQ